MLVRVVPRSAWNALGSTMWRLLRLTMMHAKPYGLAGSASFCMEMRQMWLGDVRSGAESWSLKRGCKLAMRC